MALPRDEYKALEDIVGPENISEEPAVMDSYAFQFQTEMERVDQSHWNPRAEAVLTPGSAEEIQAIVRTCNKYKTKVKAHSTGWGAWTTVNDVNCIFIDPRRMNRILEIDEQNMLVVVEPYVINAQLQPELMKRGLNIHMVGAGASCSALATCTSWVGPGPDSLFMGASSQNLLACEWVTPTGDIVRTGSWGSGAGCFCGEGPGPSVRSIIRGELGGGGGLGVFTKCAIKVHPWPGPPQVPIEGAAPCYIIAPLETITAHTVAFPNWEAYAEACYKITRAEIAYVAHRQFNQWGVKLWPAILRIYTDKTKHLDDLEELLEMPEIQKLAEESKHSFQIILAGNTPTDLEYKEKVLDKILADLGGCKLAAMEKRVERGLTLAWIGKLSYKSANWFFNNFIGGSTPFGTPDFVVKTTEPIVSVKRQFMGIGPESITDEGGDAFMAALSYAGGETIIAWEPFIFYDSASPDSVKGINDFIDAMLAFSGGKGWGHAHVRHFGASGLSDAERQELLHKGKDLEAKETQGLEVPTVEPLRWQWKIKQAMDPNDIGDFSYFVIKD
jgi:glycolate oxidase